MLNTRTTNRSTIFYDDCKPRMVYKPMARIKNSTFKENVFWSAVNVAAWLGCMYTITEMAGHLPKFFM